MGDKMLKKSDAYKVIDIRYNSLKKQDYYVLVPIDNENLRIDIPVNNKMINICHLI